MRYRAFTLSSATMPLIIVNIIIFILQTAIPGLTESLLFMSSEAFTRPWIFITSMFVHGGPYHLLFNMYALFLFGTLIEQRIGTKRFIFIYFVSGILGSLVSIPFYTSSLGASGAIMGIIGVTIMLLPDLKVLLFFAIPMTLRTAAIIFALIDIFGIFFPFGVASIDHLVGLGCGLIFGFYLLKKKGRFNERLAAKTHENRARHHKGRPGHPGIEMSRKDMDDYLRYGRL